MLLDFKKKFLKRSEYELTQWKGCFLTSSLPIIVDSTIVAQISWSKFHSVHTQKKMIQTVLDYPVKTWEE